MKIKFIKEYRAIPLSGGIDNYWGCYKDEVKDVHDDQGQWLIDNGFAEEVKESGWWKPEYDERYFFVDNNGDVEADRWFALIVDRDRFAIGNCFKTRKATECWRDYLKASATVRQDEGVLTPKEIDLTERSNGIVWAITYTFDSGLFVHTCRLAMVLPQIGAIYFYSQGHAQASLDKHPDEWKIIANYDWSRE